MKALLALAPAAALVVGLAAPALAAFDSAYTDIDLDECTVISADDFGAVWACPGHKGTPVRIAEGDLRFYVSYGFGAEDEPAAMQTPSGFNYIGPKLEWRLSNAGGGWKPIATILRYFVSRGDGETEAQVLVVTQLVPGATCHIAYVDALANSDANELAREAADELAGEFDCAENPEIVGEFEAWEN